MKLLPTSFTSPSVYKNLGMTDPSEYPQAVRISNPLGEDQSIMRTTMLASILEVLSHNYNRQIKSAVFLKLIQYLFPKHCP